MAELATERRIFVPYSAIPDMVKQAFVSAEDQNFWTHPGVDPLAIARAGGVRPDAYGPGAAADRRLDDHPAGRQEHAAGQQVSLARKAREAILAMRIEQTLSKQRILELYLNEIYLGLGAYGVAAAAQAYFNKPLDKLTLPEAAFLAALPKAPNNYNPFKFPDAAKARRDWVLDRMAEDHVITAAQATAAKAEPIVPSEFRRPQPIPGADWFAEEVRRELIAQFGADVTTQGGLMVRTSLDPALQVAAEKAVRDGLMAYDRKLGGWRGPVAHLDGGPALAKNWAEPLGQMARPQGMLPDWKLAVVLETTDGEARLGWLELACRPDTAARTGALPLVRDCLGAAGQGRQARAGASAHHRRDAAGRRGDGRAAMQTMPTAPPAKNGKPAACTVAACWRCGRFPRCRARWCRSTPSPAACWPWSAAGASKAASSTAPRRRSASLAPASSRSSI